MVRKKLYLLVLPLGDAAGIGIAGRTGWDGECAGLGDSDLGLSRGGGDLRGGGGAGDGEDEDESADDVFHKWTTPKVVFTF